MYEVDLLTVDEVTCERARNLASDLARFDGEEEVRAPEDVYADVYRNMFRYTHRAPGVAQMAGMERGFLLGYCAAAATATNAEQAEAWVEEFVA